ncbi:LuxR family two component transcriptional regulator [Microcella alkaliphila]|uniref:LuxR family two component transcriptional regulator n=1 Tax=Microcella alkaliphila TaxID=279828 RepID=A0A4Q7TIU4_9MICO|nr:response regulator transcription factor [Microcella alkaliphila]RZT59747.1 LuxR family two component transcriptional regulator [Microcella alkaliphila]
MSDAATSIRVLLVDDHALVRSGFRAILESEPDIAVVGEAANGDEAIAQAAALTPDVICMDVQMPGMDGLEATRRITADRGGRAGVLVLTTFDRDDYLFAALEAGAAGFLLKNASPEKLVEAVRVVASGDALLAPDVTRRVIARATGTGARGVGGANGETPEPDARLTELTEREREVLTLLARGLANAEIARELWLGEATVKTHVSKILQKLGLRDRVHAVVFAYENGVAVPGETPAE